MIGLCNVFDASPETRTRTLFEEGFGAVGGALGTKAGVAVGLRIVTILGLGPFGLFITVFICATAGGIAGNELFKKGAEAFYDWGEHLNFGQIYHSYEQLIEAF